MQFGNVGINPEAFKGYTKEKFFQQFRGVMDYDLEKAWVELSAELDRLYPDIKTFIEKEKVPDPEKPKRMRKKNQDKGTLL